MKLFQILLINIFCLSNIYSQWSFLGNLGGNNDIMSICSDKDGNIYAAGRFTNGNTSLDGKEYVAKYDGTAWSEVGASSNPFTSDIYSICSDLQGNIYAAGTFKNSNTGGGLNPNFYVAKYDGTAWSELGGLNALNKIYPGIWSGGINTICSDKNDNIYASGGFYNALGKRYVAKFNGNGWFELKMGAYGLNANGDVLSICSDKNGNIYAAGKFTNGTSSSNGNRYVAKFDGTAWSELGGINGLSANNDIMSICSDKDGNIYAAGGFSSINGRRVAKFDGTAWSELGRFDALVNANGTIRSICSDKDGNIYAAGNFSNINGNRYVAKYDGTAWSKLGVLSGNILSLHSDASGNIYAAGSIVDSYIKKNVARLNGNNNSKIEFANTDDLISIYPTPIKSILNIKVKSELLYSDFIIYNSFGVMILNGKINSEDISIEMDTYSSGIYLIRIGEGNYKKIIVSK
jgi:hypothetical protein